MGSSSVNLHDGSNDRSSRAQRVIDDCLRRRILGESLSDDQVIAGHPDLMPELGEALRKLALVQRAVQRGHETSSQHWTETLEVHPHRAVQPPPNSFTGYEITGEIHRGGQAIVYRALQKSTKRRVAIKVMKEGPFAGPADKARFEREVHILGQLKHPNIVTIYDTGEAAGHFYYTMDYISGRTLDAYMAAEQCSIGDTLRLFVRVCDAVNAAHLRGVIHRDLKPSNIRVDADGEPYILDFGLAKVTANRTEAAPMTMTGQFVGSLPWASPEQAEGSPSQIDIRTDVYSLGVILYQMLTGRFPYQIVGTMRDVLDNILKAEPARPSAIRRQIDDEVETIVLKSLSKERERRYQTAGELGRDISHYLNGEPIEAKRDSVAYLLRKQLRRYRLPVVIVAAFVVVVTVGFFSSLTFWRQAVVERRLAEANAQAAEDHATEAMQEATKAKAVTDFLQGMLASVDPSGSFDREVTVREVLDEAARNVADGPLATQPEVEATIRATIGNTYRALGLYPTAEPHLRAALEIRRRCFGEEHPEVADSLTELALLLDTTGDYTESERLCRQALAMRRRLFGDVHAAVAVSLNNLGLVLRHTGDYAEAETLYRDALEMRRKLLGYEHAEVATTLDNLAMLLADKGDYDGAEPLYREALAIKRKVLGDEHPDVATSLNNLAILLMDKGDYAEGEALCREALAMRRSLLGDEHPRVATSLNNLASLLMDKGDYEGAETLLREVLTLRRKLLGDEHPRVATTLSNLALSLYHQGDLAEAKLLYREALAMRRKLLGDEHPHVAVSLNTLALLLKAKGDYGEAERLYREALAVRRKALGDEHPSVATSLNNLAVLLRDKGDYAEAEALARDALAMRRELLGDEHPRVASTLSTLASLLKARADYEQAEALYREALAINRKSLGDKHPSVASSLKDLAVLLMRKGDYAEAEVLAREALAMRRELMGDENPYVADSLNDLGVLLTKKGDYAEAETLAREALAMRRKLLGDEHPSVASSLNNLAVLLRDQGDYAEAEPMFREALAIRRASLPPGHRLTLSTLANLGDTLVEQENFAEAETLLREYLPAARDVLPDGDPTIARALSDLGVVLTDQAKYEEAEHLLLEAYRHTKDNPDAPPDRAIDTLERICKLYEAWDAAEPDKGHDAKATEWRAKLRADSDAPGNDAAHEPDAP